MGSFCNNWSPSLQRLSAIKGRGVSSVGADVFFIEGVSYGAFRGEASRYHHRGCRWPYKSRAGETGGRERDRGKKPSKTKRKKIHSQSPKQRKRKHRNPENPTLISSSLSPANQEKEEPNSKP